MVKHYVYDNANRRLKSGKFTFAFDVVEQFGGSWRGVLKLDDEEQIKALESFATRLGVREIPVEEYERLLKKKLNSPPSSPDIIRQPVSRLAAAAGHVVIKDAPLSQTTPNGSITGTANPKPAISDAVVVGSAPFVDPLEVRSNKRGRKKS
jgi:hypothetical protein